MALSLKNKSDSLSTFRHFQTLIEKFFNRPIKQFNIDNGGEFIKLKPHFSACGISHLTSPPHTPEHNGYVERCHRHIVEMGLTLLSHANLPVSFWPLAFTTAVYLINRLPTPTLNNNSPYFVFLTCLLIIINYGLLVVYATLVTSLHKTQTITQIHPIHICWLFFFSKCIPLFGSSHSQNLHLSICTFC